MWDPPRPGLEPVSPALAGRFSTTTPPGKPYPLIFVFTGNIPPRSLCSLSPKLDCLLSRKSYHSEVSLCYRLGSSFYWYFSPLWDSPLPECFGFSFLSFPFFWWSMYSTSSSMRARVLRVNYLTACLLEVFYSILILDTCLGIGFLVQIFSPEL